MTRLTKSHRLRNIQHTVQKRSRIKGCIISIPSIWVSFVCQLRPTLQENEFSLCTTGGSFVFRKGSVVFSWWQQIVDCESTLMWRWWLVCTLWYFITAGKRCLRQGNVFTPVCLFTGGLHPWGSASGGLPTGGSAYSGSPSRGLCLQGVLHRWGGRLPRTRKVVRIILECFLAQWMVI